MNRVAHMWIAISCRTRIYDAEAARGLDNRKSVDVLGLSGSEGVWSTLGGPDDAGGGVVVGVMRKY